MLNFFALTLLIACTQAHLCLLDPPQRGGFQVATPGQNDCFRPKAECGGQASGTPTKTFVVGQQAYVGLQQNANHWYGSKPGQIDLAISTVVNNPTASDFTMLWSTADFPAHEMLRFVNFTIPVTFQTACSHCVLRARYITNNPDESTTPFYQCADIAIVSNIAAGDVNDVADKPRFPLAKLVPRLQTAEEYLERQVQHLRFEGFETLRRQLASIAHAVAPAAPAAQRFAGCCVPPELAINGEQHLASVGKRKVGSTIFHMARSKQRNMVSYKESILGTPYGWRSLTDYNKMKEWRIDYPSGKCTLLGPDKRYNYCFGNLAAPGTQQLKSARNMPVFNGTVLVYSTSTPGRFFTAFHMNGTPDNVCVPQSFQDPAASAHTVATYFNPTTKLNSMDFNLPPQCP